MAFHGVALVNRSIVEYVWLDNIEPVAVGAQSTVHNEADAPCNMKLGRSSGYPKRADIIHGASNPFSPSLRPTAEAGPPPAGEQEDMGSSDAPESLAGSTRWWR